MFHQKYGNYDKRDFNSGLVTGHVWVNAYTNNKWVKLDPTGPKNEVNKIKNFKYKSRNAVSGKGGDDQKGVDGKFINLNC